nr:hypothetical transcript [Hymenolepis microstoma]
MVIDTESESLFTNWFLCTQQRSLHKLFRILIELNQRVTFTTHIGNEYVVRRARSISLPDNFSILYPMYGFFPTHPKITEFPHLTKKLVRALPCFN